MNEPTLTPDLQRAIAKLSGEYGIPPAVLEALVYAGMQSVRPERAHMSDPTYRIETIQTSPAWALAFRLSEYDNDNAPLGWGRYIPIASWLLANFEMRQKRI